MIDNSDKTTSSSVLDDLMPGELSALTSPVEVLEHKTLSVASKRAILADWASDIHAVTDQPALRQLENGARIEIDAILEALKVLDRQASKIGNSGLGSANTVAPPRRKRPRRDKGWDWRFMRDDDDDPPLPPAASAWPVFFERLEDVRAAA